jgi:hypothetical protein
MKETVKNLLFISSLLFFAGCKADLMQRKVDIDQGPVDIKVVQARFKNTNIVMDQKSGIPSRITNLSYRPKLPARIAIPIRDKDVALVSKAFLDENVKALRVNPANLKLISKTTRNGKWYVKYQQLHQGVPILNATVGMVGTEQGNVTNYTASYLPGIRINVKEKISKKKAISIARGTYEKNLMSELKVRKIEKSIMAFEKDSAQKYYLIWRIDMVTQSNRAENDKIFFIDAQNGEILKQYPSRFPGSRAYGIVNAGIYPENPTDAVTTVPLAHERVRANGFLWNGKTNTDLSGAWQIDAPWWTSLFSWFSQYQATYQLIGPFAHVQDDGGIDYIEHRNCQVDKECNFTWTAADRDHINVFYHINRIHDWYQSHLSYNWINAWDNTSRFNAEVNIAGNNAWAGDPMLFGANNFARSSDVVYHECTHNVLVALFGDYIGWQGPASRWDEPYALDEGFADYFSCAMTEDPRHGEGYGGTRTLDNTDQYQGKATYNLDGHDGGMIIGGAAWDMREEIQTWSSALFVDNLIFDALNTMATMPRDYYFSDPQESNFLSSLYIADDDNNNLMDGVPHFYDIQEAFHDHNLLQAELIDKDSYDVSTNSLGSVTGGDFYFYDNAFWSNNFGQRGVQDLGDIGIVDLEDVDIPVSGYTRQRVDAVVDHTYVALAQAGEEGSFIVFRVTDLDAANNEVVIRYLYRTPLMFEPIDICEIFPGLCEHIYPCDKYPFLCDREIVLAHREGLIIEFKHELDKVVIPIDKICKYVLDCPGCEATGYCPEYQILFEEMPQQFDLTVYDSNGEIIVENLKRSTTKILKFEADKELKYFLVVSPGRRSKINEKYLLPMEINTGRPSREIP